VTCQLSAAVENPSAMRSAIASRYRLCQRLGGLLPMWLRARPVQSGGGRMSAVGFSRPVWSRWTTARMASWDRPVADI
jgi:hypothetical protein